MKVEIIQAETINELDHLINSVIEGRRVSDIKLSTVVLSEEKIKYIALIMLGD